MNSNKRVLVYGWLGRMFRKAGCGICGNCGMLSICFASPPTLTWKTVAVAPDIDSGPFQIETGRLFLSSTSHNVTATVHVYNDVTSPQNAVTDLLASTVTQVKERVDSKLFRPFTLKTGHKLCSLANARVIKVAQRPQGVESKHSLIRDGRYTSSENMSS